MDDGLYMAGQAHWSATPGAVRIDAGQGPSFVELGPPVEPSKVLIYARDNANTLFAFVAHHAPPCGCGVLILGSRVMVGSSYGSDDRGCYMHLELDPDDANRAARFFGTKRQDRSPHGEHVVGTFTTRARYAVGEPVEVVLTITNPGAPIRWLRGGRQRGPRNDQFDFEVRRDGVLIPRIDAHNLGGMCGFRPLGRGDRAEVRTPLARWADLSAAGRYEVTCSFETELMPLVPDPFDDDARGAIWDRRFVGTVCFEIG